MDELRHLKLILVSGVKCCFYMRGKILAKGWWEIRAFILLMSFFAKTVFHLWQ